MVKSHNFLNRINNWIYGSRDEFCQVPMGVQKTMCNRLEVPLHFSSTSMGCSSQPHLPIKNSILQGAFFAQNFVLRILCTKRTNFRLNEELLHGTLLRMCICLGLSIQIQILHSSTGNQTNTWAIWIFIAALLKHVLDMHTYMELPQISVPALLCWITFVLCLYIWSKYWNTLRNLGCF